MSRKRRNIKNGEHSFGPLTYLVREISKHPVLKAEEQKELARKFKGGDQEAGKKLILSNLRYVFKIAMKYKEWGIALEDLISEGILGLISALQKYDPEKGINFLSYATYWIVAFIQNYIQKNISVVNLTAVQRIRILPKIFKIKDEDIEEQEKILNVSRDEIKFLTERLKNRDLSLDRFINNDGLKAADLVEADIEAEPLKKIEKDEERKIIERELGNEILSSLEKAILTERYLEGKKKTYYELAEEFKIGKHEIVRIEKQAKRKMKKLLGKYKIWRNL